MNFLRLCPISFAFGNLAVTTSEPDKLPAIVPNDVSLMMLVCSANFQEVFSVSEDFLFTLGSLIVQFFGNLLKFDAV